MPTPSLDHRTTLFLLFAAQGFFLAFACRLLANGSRAKERILDVACQSGFTNKTTFYKVFRSATGQSPAACRQRHHKQPSQQASS